MTLSPITLFVYNRIKNTRQTIEALQQNALAGESDLYIFSDGGKDEKTWEKVNELRQYLHTVDGFKNITIIERKTNYYLERNIIEGVTEILSRYGKIIVLEDDVKVNSYFLQYMNEALSLYTDKPQVMHLSSIPHFDVDPSCDANFTSLMECTWGWATWADRWQYFKHFKTRAEALQGLSRQDMDNIEYNGRFSCLKTLDKDPIPWDICWAIAIYKQHGLCLEPLKPLSENTGLYDGTHYRRIKLFGKDHYDRPFSDFKVERFPQELKFNADLEYKLFNEFEGFGIQYNVIGKWARKIYKWFQ